MGVMVLSEGGQVVASAGVCAWCATCDGGGGRDVM